MSVDELQELQEILNHVAISVEFQPIVDLVTGAAVGYEALSRGPDSSPLHMPAQLFETARDADRLAELDWQCRITALRSALDADMRPPLTVFMNVEPRVLSAPPAAATPILARAMGGLRVIIELTERDLLGQPGSLLRFVEQVRHSGWGIAVDDIGAHPHSLAMLSVLEPDVVKLDLPLLLKMPRPASAALISGVQTYCRRSGARIVAEGLADEDEVETARSLGAQYGQGFHFGRPVPMPKAPPPTTGAIPLIEPRPHLPTRRLIHLLSRSEPPQRAGRDRINRITASLLEHAGGMGPNTLVLASVQSMAFVAPTMRDAFRQAARRVAHLGMLGAGVPARPLAGAAGTKLRPGDPLLCEWVIVTIGLQEAIALVASDLGDDPEAGPERRYDYAVTYNPQMVTDVARALLSRIYSRTLELDPKQPLTDAL